MKTLLADNNVISPLNCRQWYRNIERYKPCAIAPAALAAFCASEIINPPATFSPALAATLEAFAISVFTNQGVTVKYPDIYAVMSAAHVKYPRNLLCHTLQNEGKQFRFSTSPSSRAFFSSCASACAFGVGSAHSQWCRVVNLIPQPHQILGLFAEFFVFNIGFALRIH